MKKISFESRYFQKGESSWEDVAKRVASIIPNSNRVEVADIIAGKKMIPSSPILMNAGKPGMNMMACNLLDVGDSIDEIFESLKSAAMITKSGGGVGLNFSALRKAGGELHYTDQGVASGPVSFMSLFDRMAKVIMQGGWRRGALMGILSAHHPDAQLFIKSKCEDGLLSNFNISVSIEHGPDSVPDELWNDICKHACLNGEPGLLFLDNINDGNPYLDKLGPITGTNPCSEVPQYANESCCLASINLPAVMRNLRDFSEFEYVIRKAVTLLDAVIDYNNYYSEENEGMCKKLRRIGIGVMGFDTLLRAHDVKFGSYTAQAIGADIAYNLFYEANMQSTISWNIACTSIAPTGHISQVAGVSPSIYTSWENGLTLDYEQHINHIGAWQDHVDNGISYTIPLHNDATPEDVDKIFRMAHRRGLKTVCVYRDGSRRGQPSDCKSGSCIL